MLNENVNLTGKTIPVTGAAGFVGSALTVAGLDSYDASLKEYRRD